MSLTITIPQLGKKATTKDYIVTLLGSNWPLTAKKIYSAIKFQYAYGATYQAVFKTLSLLVKEGVVEKLPQGYQLNLKWLQDLRRYTEVTESNYYTRNRFNLLGGIKQAKTNNDLSVLTFANLFDVEKYLYYLQKQYLLTTEKPEIVCVHHFHEWRPLFYLRAEYNYQRKLRELKHQTYVLCQGNSVVDNWSANFYRQNKCYVRTKSHLVQTHELMVFSDWVIQVFIPPQIKQKMDELLNKDPAKLDCNLLIREIFEKEANIQVIIHQNAALAEQLKKETIKEF